MEGFHDGRDDRISDANTLLCIHHVILKAFLWGSSNTLVLPLPTLLVQTQWPPGI
jgi:hypothetical protein